MSRKNLAVAARYDRLAAETTGKTQRIMLKLAAAARAGNSMSSANDRTIDLVLVARPPGSPETTVKNYA